MNGNGESKSKVLKARQKGKSSRGCFGWILILFLLAAAAGAGYWYFFPSTVELNKLTEKVLSKVDTGKSAHEVKLYFADPQWTRLVPQTASMPAETDKARRIAKLVELLARGPSGNLAPVLPKNAAVRQAYLGPKGVAIIDFEPGFEEVRQAGTAAEMLSVFAVVHTISENVDGISSVRILVGGEMHETLAGNVTISEPLSPRPGLVGQSK